MGFEPEHRRPRRRMHAPRSRAHLAATRNALPGRALRSEIEKPARHGLTALAREGFMSILRAFREGSHRLSGPVVRWRSGRSRTLGKRVYGKP